ncbi:MAG: carbohydrate kinase family protein [Nitrososphaerales archaeon]
MHDFFIDRIVRINDFGSLISKVSAKAKVGGGSIRGIMQEEIKGGNAVNVAYSLARLGAKVSLITIGDSIGESILKEIFSPFKARLIIASGKPGYTISFELGRKKANVMVSDVGDMCNFDAGKLRKNELNAIKKASAVAVTNWASNIKGTDLARKAFENASKGALRFLDPADISTRRKEFRKCLQELSGYFDVLSVNENECRLTMRFMGLEALPVNYSSRDIMDAAKALASKLSTNVDVHTPMGSSTSNGKETIFARSVKVKTAVSTGAGDVWDAADIAGYLCGLDGEERLLFANASAALYISKIESPTFEEVSKFFKTTAVLL